MPDASGISPTVVAWLVFGGAGLSTLVASVMADEQSQRLKNGAFGTVAGSFVGALMALVTDNELLVIVGFVGSAIGATAGWLISLLLSLLAATTSVGRTVLEYQIGGWHGVRDRLSLEEREPLLRALTVWSQNFSRVVRNQKEELQSLEPSVQRNRATAIVVHGWLVSVVEIVDLLFTLGKRPGYRSRMTLIVYGRNAEGEITGVHWLSDAGRLPSHKIARTFDEKSIGYQVLTSRLASPYYTTGEEARQRGQDRGEQTYRPFLTFRLTDSAILAVDWPIDLSPDDPFLRSTRDLFQLDLCPVIADLLNSWTGPLAAEVKLQVL